MILKQQYDVRKKSDPGFKHRNWFREDRTLDDIRSGVDMALALGQLPKFWS